MCDTPVVVFWCGVWYTDGVLKGQVITMALTTGKFFMYSKDMDTVKAFDSKEAACTYIVRSGCETFHAISEVEAISIMLDDCKTAERSLLSRSELSKANMDALCAINNMETLDDLYQAYLMVN